MPNSGDITSAGGSEHLIVIPQNKSESLGEFLGLVQVFSGENPGFTMYDFFYQIDEIASYAAWSDEKRVFAAKMYVTGEAARFLKSQPQANVKTYKDFKAELINRFGYIENTQNILLPFTTATQNIELFKLGLRGLHISVFQMNVQGTKCLAGLQASTRRFIMAESPTTFDEIWNLALKEEECSQMEQLESIQVVNRNLNTNRNQVQKRSDIQELTDLVKQSLETNDKKIQNLAEQIKKLTLDKGRM